MIFLLLIAFLAFIGVYVAAPLFEFVFATLLLVPTVRFLIGYGLLQFGYTIPNGIQSVGIYALCLAFVVGFAFKIFGKRQNKIEKSEFYPVVFFGVVFSLAFGLCMLWPDFVDLGERLRDYAILSSSIHSPVQPLEPWMDGIKLNYYVYWYRFGNLLSNVLGIEVWQAYHVAVSFAISFYAAVVFQLVRVVVRGSPSLAFFSGILIPFGSNVAGVLSWKRAEKGMGWEPDNGWWGPSRVLQGAIDEFPAWSFVLGDAHPHFLNLGAFPFFILILYRILSSGMELQARLVQGAMFVLAATLFLMASNAWEVPMWMGTVAAVGVFAGYLLSTSGISIALPGFQGKGFFEIVRAVVAVIVLLASLVAAVQSYAASNLVGVGILLVVGIGFSVWSFPFKTNIFPSIGQVLKRRPPPLHWVVFWSLLFVALKLSSQHIVPEGMKIDMVRSPIPVTTTAELFVHWGIQLFFITLGSILLLRFSFQSVVMVAFLGLAVLYDKAALYLYTILGLQVVRMVVDKTEGGKNKWADVFESAILVAGLVLILTPEIVFVNDSYGPEIERMNTIFKLYTTAWGLLGLGAVSVMHRAFAKFSPQLLSVGPFFPAMVGGVICVGLVFASSRFYLHTAPMRKNGAENQPGAMQEGLGSANRWHPGAAEIIRALRVLPRGRVLEAQGRPYSYTCFVSTLSAQPSYLGWANHINLLTKEYMEVSRRQKVTDEMYREVSCEKRKEMAIREKISYVVVGTLERKNYSGVENLDFSCFIPAARAEQYALYQVPQMSM